MKTTVAIFFFLTSAQSFASLNTYNLAMDLTMAGKHVGTSTTTVREGEMAGITHTKDSAVTFIDVVASEGETRGHQAILMKFVVGKIENGVKTIVSKPQVWVKENSPAKISYRKPGTDTDDFSLSVTAQRKTAHAKAVQRKSF